MAKGNTKRSSNISSKLFKKIIFFAIILGYVSFISFGSHGLITLSELSDEYDQNQNEINTLKEENSNLRSEIELIKNDTYKIEKIAREKYNMHKKGETVFVIEKK